MKRGCAGEERDEDGAEGGDEWGRGRGNGEGEVGVAGLEEFWSTEGGTGELYEGCWEVFEGGY